jgi:hypothetical protein
MEQLSGPGWWKWERKPQFGGVNPTVQPTLSQDGNSFVVSWTEQNI